MTIACVSKGERISFFSLVKIDYFYNTLRGLSELEFAQKVEDMHGRKECEKTHFKKSGDDC